MRTPARSSDHSDKPSKEQRSAAGRSTTQKVVRGVRRVAAVLLVLYVVVGATFTVAQGQMIFLPDQDVLPVHDVVSGGEVVSARTPDGIDLTMWLVRGAEAACPSPGLLLLHGTGGNRAYMAVLAAKIARHGVVVLVADYRGYGGNAGRPTDDGLALDAIAARDLLARQPGVDPNRIAYLGDSLGTGVASLLAVSHPPQALVLRAPFTSIPDVAGLRFPMYPTHLLVRERFDTIDRIGKVPSPLLVITGSADTLVPVEQSRRVFDAATAPKQWILRPGATTRIRCGRSATTT